MVRGMTKRFWLFSLLACLAVMATASPAAAHYVTWRDPDFNIDITFPDTWKTQGGLNADGRYKVLAPGADSAQCTLSAKNDRRYMIYPRDYVADILAQDMQWHYWEQTVSNYDDLYFYYDNFGALNGGPARYTLVDYIDRTPEKTGGASVRKRAWVYGAIAGELHVNVICSATLNSFESHADDFSQIIDSVSFPAPYTTTYNSAYRDVLKKNTTSPVSQTLGPLLVYLLPRAPFSRLINCPKTMEYPACLFKPKQRLIPTR